MDGYITIKTQLDNTTFDKEIEYVEAQMRDVAEKIKQADAGFEVGDTQKLEAQYEKLSRKLTTLITKQKELNNADLKKIESSVNNVSKATGNVISKIGKWALAIFSVRTAYGAVTSAMSTLTQYDDQLKTDLEYIKFSVAMGLKPVIEFIVNLAYRLLAIIRAIGIALFDFDIFSEATAKNFQKAGGSAQKLKKTLAGFDEMNVLNSNSNGGGGGVAGIGKPPEIGIDEGALSFFEKVKKAYIEMGEALANPDIFRDAFGAWGTFIEGVTRIFYGLFRVIDGIMKVIVGLITGDTEKIKDGVITIITGLLNIILGELQTLVGFVQGILYEIGTAIYSLFVAIGSTIKKYLIQPIINALSWLGEKIGKAIADVVSGVKQKFEPIANWMNKYVIKPIKSFFDGLWTSLKAGPKGFVNYMIETFEKAINWIGKNFANMLNKISFKVPDWIPEVGGKTFGVNIKYKDVKLPRLAKGTILNNPGQGVLVGGGRAIGGEAGREAYLPLSDTQLLEELGSTIGRYITINANIVNSMNGRIISRELKRINANDNFAMNK